MHNTCTKHGNTSRRIVLGRHQSCYKERINILSNSIECYHLSRNTSSLLYPKVVRMKTGKVIYEKVHMSPQLLPKISLRHEWKRELGSEHAQRPKGQVVQQSRSFQSNQPIPNPSRHRSGQPVGETSRTQTRSSDDSKSLNVELAHHRSRDLLSKHRKCAKWLRNTFLVMKA